MISRLLVMATFVFAGTMLMAWLWRPEFMDRQMVLGNPLMVPNTALWITLLSGALLFRPHSLARGTWRSRASALIGIAVLIYTLATVLEYVLGSSWGIDNLVATVNNTRYMYPGRPSPESATGLFLLAASVIGLSCPLCGRSGTLVAHITAVAVGLFSLTAITGYYLGTELLYSPIFHERHGLIGLSLSTGFVMLLMSCAVLMTRPQESFMQLLISPTLGGTMARRLLFAVLLCPAVAGTVAFASWRLELLSGGLATSLGALAVIVMLSIVTWVTARRLERSDRARERSEQNLLHSENLLNLMLETLPVGVCLTDTNGRPVRINPAARRIWGATSSRGGHNITRADWPDLLGWWAHNGQRLRAEDWAAARVLDGRVPQADDIVEIEAFDGVRRVISNSAVPVYDRERKLHGILIVNADMTKRCRLEQKNSFLAKASKALLEPMDVNRILKRVTELAVPDIADACSIAFFDEAKSKVEWVAHSFRSGPQVENLEALLRYEPRSQNFDEVLLHGQSVLVPRVDEETFRASAVDETHFRLLCETVHSYLLVPVRTARGVMGVMASTLR